MRWTAALAILAATGCLEAPPAAMGSPSDASGPDAVSVPLDATAAPVLLAAYRFEMADPLADDSGNGHDAACTGQACPTFIADRNGTGQAVLFDGLDDLVTLEPIGTGPFTVMGWVRADSLEETTIVCPVNRSFEVVGVGSYKLCLRAPSPSVGRLLFYTTDDPILLAQNVAMEVGAWHHIAIRWDGSQKTISLDGFDVATAAAKTQFDESPICLGGAFDGENLVDPFVGALDDLEIWQGALPEKAIAEAAGL